MKKLLILVTLVFLVSLNAMAADSIGMQKPTIAPIKPTLEPMQKTPKPLQKVPTDSHLCPGGKVTCDSGYECIPQKVKDRSGKVTNTNYTCQKKTNDGCGPAKSDCAWNRI